MSSHGREKGTRPLTRREKQHGDEPKERGQETKQKTKRKERMYTQMKQQTQSTAARPATPVQNGTGGNERWCSPQPPTQGCRTPIDRPSTRSISGERANATRPHRTECNAVHTASRRATSRPVRAAAHWLRCRFSRPPPLFPPPSSVLAPQSPPSAPPSPALRSPRSPASSSSSSQCCSQCNIRRRQS